MSDQNDFPGLPASIATAWGRRVRPTRGPKPGLSLERIIAAAIAVASAEGLAAVSMSRVAAEIGTGAMSLYRYVASKDELLMLMADAAIGDPPPRPADEDWRAGMTRWAWGYRTALYGNPWIVRIPISGPPITPNTIVWLEDCLQSLSGTGLEEHEKMSAILLLSGYVRNDAQLVADITAAAQAAGTDADDVMPGYGQLLADLTDPNRFPALHQVLAGGVFDPGAPPDDEFTFGLDRILDGVEVLIRSRR